MEAEASDGLASGFLRDLGITVVALGLALAFWGSVQLSTDVQDQLSLRVHFVPPEGQMVVGDKVHRVQINAIASMAVMEQYKRQRGADVVRIPTDSFGLGGSTIYLNRDLLGLPKSLRIEAIRPSVVRVNLARRITRQLPVRPEITGKPSAGLKVKRWNVEPDQVTVDGPEDAVMALTQVLAGPVSVDKQVKNLVRMVPLRTGATGVQVVDLHEAEVRIEIAAPLLDRQLTGVPVVVKAAGWTAVPDVLTLRLKGPLDTLNRLKNKDVRAVVDESVVIKKRGGARALVRLEGLPQGVVRLGPVPEVRLVKRAPAAAPKEMP